MKKFILFFLLLPSLAWGSDLGQDYARMNPYILGGGVSADYVFDRIRISSTDIGSDPE